MKAEFPEIGKIQQRFLKDYVFPSSGAFREEVVKGPGYGVDTSVVRISDQLALVMATDPASLIPTLGLEESAWLTVHLVASDIATAGCMPQYAQFCLNLPPGLSEQDFENYWKAISRHCQELDIAITGGHTGKVEGQNSTVSGGVTMISCVHPDSVLTSDMARPGDDLILVKQPAISSTAILALSFPETIRQKCGVEVLQKGQELFQEATVVHSARVAAASGLHDEGVRAMHDVTEGGVLGAVIEMMTAAQCGVEIVDAKIPRGEVQQCISDLFQIDQRFSIGGGALLLSVVPQHTKRVINRLETASYSVAVIGKVTEPLQGMTIIEGDERRELKHPGVDPYWGAFFTALKRGLK